MPRIFITYRREDSGGHAGRVFDRLVAAFGRQQVFFDVELAPGADYEQAIHETIDAADAVVVIIGPNWLDCTDASGRRRLDDPHDLVRREIEEALARPERVTIPVLIRGAQMPERESLPESLQPLARRNGLEISETRFDYDVGRLVDTLRREPPPATGAARVSLSRMAVAGTALLVALAVALLVVLPRVQNVEVPKVVGMESAFAAEQQLVKHGLELDANQKTMVDEDAVPGSVLAQTPEAGEQLRKGSAVTVLIAVGSGEVTVPKVVGATLEEADSRLRQRQLTLGQVSPQNARLDAKIARQIPRAGEKVKAGTAVSVFLPAQ